MGRGGNGVKQDDCYVEQKWDEAEMKRNISNTQEDRKLTWSVRATEDTGTCGGQTRQKTKSTGVS